MLKEISNSSSKVIKNALEHEINETKKYHIKSLRYLTFRADLSRAMGYFACEGRLRIKTFLRSETNYNKEIIKHVQRELLDSASIKERHFFVFNDTTAQTLLDESHFHASISLEKYKSWAQKPRAAEFKKIFQEIIAQKEKECKILHAFQACWPNSPCMTKAKKQ